MVHLYGLTCKYVKLKATICDFDINKFIILAWDSLKQFLCDIEGKCFKFDIVGLTEIFRIPKNVTYTIDGYHPLQFNTRPENDDGRGGVGLFINNNLNYILREDLSIFLPHVFESLFVEISINKQKSMIVGIIYRPNSPPRANLDTFIDTITKINYKITRENKQAIIMGDFNIDLLKYGTHQKTSMFVDGMFSQGFVPHISKPTRITHTSATIIDHIYSNKLTHTSESGIIITDVADHFATFHIQHKRGTLTPEKHTSIRYHSTKNIANFNTLLSSFDFSNVLNTECPDEAYTKFLTVYEELYNIAFPATNKKINRKLVKREPWITKGLIKSSKTKSKLFLKKLKNPSDHNVLKYETYNKLYNKLLRIAKKTHYDHALHDYRTDIKQTWKILKEIIHKKNDKSSLPDSFTINGLKTDVPKIIAEEFNRFFANIGKRANNNVPKSSKDFSSYLTGNYVKTFFLNPVSLLDILDTARSLKPKTSCGFDDLPMKIVKETIHNITIPLAHIFNQSFSKGVVPTKMKTAKIVPIYKSGHKDQFNNYRPISLLPAFSKLLEKLYVID